MRGKTSAHQGSSAILPSNSAIKFQFCTPTLTVTHIRGRTDMNSFPGRPRCLNYQAESIQILQNKPITLLFISLLRSRRSDSRLELRTQQRRVLPPPSPLQPRRRQKTMTLTATRVIIIILRNQKEKVGTFS